MYIYIYLTNEKKKKKNSFQQKSTPQQNFFKTKIPTKSGFTKSPARKYIHPSPLTTGGAPWIQLGTRSWPEVEDGKGPRRFDAFFRPFPPKKKKKKLGNL